MVKLNRDMRWNATHSPGNPVPMPYQARRTRLTNWWVGVGMAGFALRQLDGPLWWLGTILVAIFGVLLVGFGSALTVLGILGLRSGWAVNNDDETLILQGPIRRRSIPFEDIASIDVADYVGSANACSGWVAIDRHSTSEARAVGMIPVSDVPRVRDLCGLTPVEQNRPPHVKFEELSTQPVAPRVLWPSTMGKIMIVVSLAAICLGIGSVLFRGSAMAIPGVGSAVVGLWFLWKECDVTVVSNDAIRSRRLFRTSSIAWDEISYWTAGVDGIAKDIWLPVIVGTTGERLNLPGLRHASELRVQEYQPAFGNIPYRSPFAVRET